MNRPTFVHLIATGFAVSVIATAGFHALTWLFPAASVLQFLIAVTALYCLVQTIWASGEKTGLLTVITCWLVASAIMVSFDSTTGQLFAVQLFFIWLVRSLYVYSSFISSMVDLALCVVSFGVVVWTVSYTGSVFLSFWCFFLSQAVVSAIPINSTPTKFSNQDSPGFDNARFEQAYRVAEKAVNQLVTKSV